MKRLGKKLIVTIIGTFTLLVMSTMICCAEEDTMPSGEIVSIGVAPGSDNTVKSNIIMAPSISSTNNEIELANSPSSVESAESVQDNKVASYTDEDYEYLVMVLTGECQSLPVEAQKKYGSVVLNRVKSSRYPNTIKEVCLQKGQYASFRDGNAYRTPTENSKQAALWLLENGSIYPEKVVYQSRGKQGKGVYEVYKGEYFCY